MSEFLKSAMGYFNASNAVSPSSQYPASSAAVATNQHNSSQAREVAAVSNGNGNGNGNGLVAQELTNSGDRMQQQQHQHSRRSDTTWLSNEDFCGQLVDLAGLKLRVKDTIAIGGFAYVFRVEDVSNHKDYALKRLISVEQETSEAIEMEIGIHRRLKNHPHIVDLVASGAHQANILDMKRIEYLLLMELCSGGSLVDYLGDAPLEDVEIFKVFYQAVCAVGHLHAQEPPISHRDIKIENFLIDGRRHLKLCDFGSASRDIHQPNLDWNARQHNTLEEKLCDVTTPMYRAPEMLDTWSNHEIGPKVDVWALGCVLYVLCFQKHPFQDSGKLRIINGNYTLTPEFPYHLFHQIIKGCLTVNPADRFDIPTLLEHLAAIAETMKWPLRGEILLKKKSQVAKSPTEHPRRNSKNSNQQTTQSSKSSENDSGSLETGRSVFYDKSSTSSTSNEAAGGSTAGTNASNGSNGANLLSSIKGGAGNFLKNLKDTSSKMMQSVQQSIARTDIDVSYITSRVLVMPTPSEGLESTYKSNNIDDVRHYIESHFAPHKVSVYNFGQKNVPRLPPPIRTVDAGNVWTTTHAYAPILNNLYTLAEDMYGFLTADTKSIVIIQSPDGGGCTSAFFVCALLMYAELTLQPEDAVQVFAVKRHPVNLRASEFRYLYYLGDLLRTPPLHPHYKNVQLLSVICQPVPRMTRARDGCRLYVEVYVNDCFVLSTLPDVYDKLPLYLAGPGTINIPLQVNVSGDLLIVLYHARKAMVRPHGIKICQFQLHTGFVPEQETLITLPVPDLDDVPDVDCVPSNFKVSLSLAVRGAATTTLRNPPWTTNRPVNSAQNLFSSHLEHQEMSDNFVTKSITENTPNRQNISVPSLASSLASSGSVSSPPLVSPVAASSMPRLRLNASPRARRRRLPPEHVAANPASRDEPLLNVGIREEEENNSVEANSVPLIMPDITSFQPEVLMIPSDTPARVDLLNVNAAPATTASFDLLGVFGEGNNMQTNDLVGSNGPIPDILSSNTQPQAFQSTANLDDILGPLNLNSSEPAMEILNPNAFAVPPAHTMATGTTSRFRITNGLTPATASSEQQQQQQQQQRQQQQKNNDPFADLANFSSSLCINFGTGNRLNSSVKPPPMRLGAPCNRSEIRTGASGGDAAPANGRINATATNIRFGSIQSSVPVNLFTGAAATSSSGSTSNGGAGGASGVAGGVAGGVAPRPSADYNRSHFVNMSTTSPSNTGASGNATGNGFGDVFADILGEQGYKFSQKAHQSPRSINDMRKVERTRDMDPNQALILEWTDGKKNNIRALLCTLHVVLWPNAKWTKCEMSQIISPTDVKKYYRKACLAVHPDKNTGTENEEVAKLIFMELSYAWNEFEKDSTQQNMFMQ